MSKKTKKRKLPPDPEEMNDQRADWAHSTLIEFHTQICRCDKEDAMCDLLADLAHYCDRNGIEFQHQLARAIGHYSDETSGKGTQLIDITLKAF